MDNNDKSKSERVQNFLDDIEEFDERKSEILQELRKIVFKIYPNANEKIKYGGLVFNIDAELICGIFVRKKHVSLEFSFGNEFSDPKEYLEGSGKYRRHLKIMNDKDIENKDVVFFVSQAFDR